MTSWKIHHEWRCIEHGDFPASHVRFQGRISQGALFNLWTMENLANKDWQFQPIETVFFLQSVDLEKEHEIHDSRCFPPPPQKKSLFMQRSLNHPFCGIQRMQMYRSFWVNSALFGLVGNIIWPPVKGAILRWSSRSFSPPVAPCWSPASSAAFALPASGKMWRIQRFRPARHWVEGGASGVDDPLYIYISRVWFQIFVIFIRTWGNDPIWLIFFKWVETTNYILYIIYF